MTYAEIVNKLKRIDNFSFARYGDGEFNAILGASNGQSSDCNCDGHTYFKDMGLRLYRILRSRPKYVMGLQPMVKRLRSEDKEFVHLAWGIDWINADVLHNHSIHTNANFKELFDALKERDIILIGNENMQWMASHISGSLAGNSYNHIIISKRDCWLEYNDVLKRLTNLVNKDTVILYCASMMSEVLIDDIYNIYGDNVTQIDVGSAFDPIVGEQTRSYHKKLKL